MEIKNWIANYLQKIGRPSIISSINSYLVGILLGVMIGAIWIRDLNDLKRLGDFLYQDLISEVTKNYFTAFISIYKSNLVASVVLILLGLIHRYIVKTIIIFNGAIVGIVIFATTTNQLEIIKFLLFTLPHGVVEIPTFILTGAMGISITKNAKGFIDRFRIFRNLIPSFFVIAILLLIAAAVEAFLIFEVIGF